MSSRERSMVPPAKPTSYYGQPVLKEPVWKWYIPAYFFAGGLSAGSTLLSAGAALAGDRRLARRSRVASVAAVGVGAGLLVADLGRPERFINMLRVARPTSPMSMGTWLLTAYGPAAGVAAATDLLGILPGVGTAAEIGAAALAPAVATYTGVLVADTSVPVWHAARKELPALFAAGAAASAGGLALATGGPHQSPSARRLAVSGAVAEVAITRIMKQRLGDLAEPYHQGRAGRLSKAAETLTVTGAALAALSKKDRRWAGVAGGALIFAGAAVERFAVMAAGQQSARDPKYTVGPQRARVDAGGGT